MKRFNILTLLVAVLITLTPNIALAEIGGLTKCSDSPAFAKREKASIKKLEQRKSTYEAGTPPALALQQQIERTEARFDKYSRSELLCGADGLPHLIADGRWSHAAEFMLPGFGFIYISGWIGWVGRKYLRAVSTTKKVLPECLRLRAQRAVLQGQRRAGGHGARGGDDDRCRGNCWQHQRRCTFCAAAATGISALPSNPFSSPVSSPY